MKNSIVLQLLILTLFVPVFAQKNKSDQPDYSEIELGLFEGESNQLSDIPKYTNLEKLKLRRLGISSLPNVFSGCNKLICLILDNNELNGFPLSVLSAHNLQV